MLAFFEILANVLSKASYSGVVKLLPRAVFLPLDASAAERLLGVQRVVVSGVFAA